MGSLQSGLAYLEVHTGHRGVDLLLRVIASVGTA